jgi:hypothetical protein
VCRSRVCEWRVNKWALPRTCGVVQQLTSHAVELLARQPQALWTSQGQSKVCMTLGCNSNAAGGQALQPNPGAGGPRTSQGRGRWETQVGGGPNSNAACREGKSRGDSDCAHVCARPGACPSTMAVWASRSHSPAITKRRWARAARASSPSVVAARWSAQEPSSPPS